MRFWGSEQELESGDAAGERIIPSSFPFPEVEDPDEGCAAPSKTNQTKRQLPPPSPKPDSSGAV